MNKNKARAKKPDTYWKFDDMALPIEVGLYYGFTPTDAIAPSKEDLAALKGLLDEEPASHELRIHAEELSALLRTHFLKNPSAPPVLTVRPRKLEPRAKRREYSLDIIGSPRSIADGIVIKAAYETAVELGYENCVVELNTIGDRESFTRFNRELGNYLKKHASELDPECRQALKSDPLAVLSCSHEKCAETKVHAPTPMNYLSEPSRAHFKAVLELMEASEVPYTVNPFLISNPSFACHTIFRIIGKEKHKDELHIVAAGSRFTQLAKRIGLRKDIPGVSATFVLKEPMPKTALKIPKPKLYLIHMGEDAKSKSLTVIEILRRANIPLHHSLTKDKFSLQLMSAEHLKVPYILIIGQKECIEHTVLVRDIYTRSQDSVRLPEIVSYLKKLM